MNRAPQWINLALVVSGSVWAAGLALGADTPPPFRHEPLGRVLRAFVRDARVDYAALRARPTDLDQYLDQVAVMPRKDFHRRSREERFALLINLYNAATLRLIVDHYPVAGIREIGLLPGAAWRKQVVRFGGGRMSLDHLEHQILRPEYRDPRLHFALVCAAKGCPPLREEPYLPERLEEQLQDQAHRFLADTGKNRFEVSTATLWLSPIFEWYSPDFTAAGGSLVAYVRPLLPAETGAALAAVPEPRVRFTPYDWSLNERTPP